MSARTAIQSVAAPVTASTTYAALVRIERVTLTLAKAAGPVIAAPLHSARLESCSVASSAFWASYLLPSWFWYGP